MHGVENWSLACRCGGVRALGSATFVLGPDPTLRPPRVGPTLVGGGNYSCERVVGGGDFLCEQVVGGEMENCRARRKVVVRTTCLSEVRCFVDEGLNEDLHPSLPEILALTLSMVSEDSIPWVIILPLWGP
jgi:hypothetical protein